MVLGAFFFSNLQQAQADFQIIRLGSTLNFVGNDVDANGVLWAGDKNFTLWKSTDNGVTFRSVYILPHENTVAHYPNPQSGIVWMVFVDSRGYIFVSAGGDKNCLYRSIDGGVNFNAVLNANDTTNRSFYIAMTEDNQGNLYAATYTIAVGVAQPLLLKSTNGGASWVKIGNFSIIHFHNIKFNPFNGYLYAVTGERSGSLSSCNDSEKIFRSKDFGATWSLVVDRTDALGTVYLGIAFVGNWVYVGQDYPGRTCQIHRFYDDGTGPSIPQVVYTPPSDGCMPFISGAFFNNSLFFANCGEAQTGTSRIVTSADGVNWNVLYSSSVTTSDIRWNFFTTNPRSGIIFGTIKAGYPYLIKDVAPMPTATPTPSPSPTPTATPDPTVEPTPTTPPPSTQPIDTSTNTQTSSTSTRQNTPTQTPKPKAQNTPTTQPTPPLATPTPTTIVPTVSPSTEPSIANYLSVNSLSFAFIAVIIVGTLSLSIRKLKKKKAKHR